jgi:hypothetical protein
MVNYGEERPDGSSPRHHSTGERSGEVSVVDVAAPGCGLEIAPLRDKTRHIGMEG